MVATGSRMVRPGLEDKELTKMVSVEEVLKKPEIHNTNVCSTN